MLLRLFRFCKTLICPTNSMFQYSGQRLLLNPLTLGLLLNRLEFCNNNVSRLRGCVQIGSTVVLQNLVTGENIKFTIVTDEKSDLNQGLVSFISTIGVAILGLKLGDTAQVKTLAGECKWQLIAVS